MIPILLALSLQQKVALSETLLSSVADNAETVRVQYKITHVEDKVTRECIAQRLLLLDIILRISISLDDEVKRTKESDTVLVDSDIRKLDVARSKSFELREQALMCRFGLAKGSVTTRMIQTAEDLVDTPADPPSIEVPEASPN
jgi:hypothetical protein